MKNKAFYLGPLVIIILFFLHGCAEKQVTQIDFPAPYIVTNEIPANITIATLDNRPYVISGEQSAGYEGFFMDTWGIPHDRYLEKFSENVSEYNDSFPKTVSDFFSSRLEAALSEKKSEVMQLATFPGQSVPEIITKVKESGNPGIIIVMNDYIRTYIGTIGKRFYFLKYDTIVILVNDKGEVVQQKQFAHKFEQLGRITLGILEIERVVRAKIEEFLNDPDISKAFAEMTDETGQKMAENGTDSSNHLNTYIEPVTGMKFIQVEGGCFDMGDIFGDGEAYERPVHEVCVDEFYIGKHEVTQGQWERVMGDNPSSFKSGGNFPVETVSWDEIQIYIAKLNELTKGQFRLPTSAEWEYAARSGGMHEKFSGGADLPSISWYDKNSNKKPHMVGTRRANGLGLHDMSGNVWEWCSDWSAIPKKFMGTDGNYYENSPRDNPQGPSHGEAKTIRGGCIADGADKVRTSYYASYSSKEKSRFLGLRLVKKE